MQYGGIGAGDGAAIRQVGSVELPLKVRTDDVIQDAELRGLTSVNCCLLYTSRCV